MDNTDLRYANQAKVAGHEFAYGVTLNNNPTVEDVWNSTPAWGFPWISSASGVSPIASPVINGGLGGDVAGVGGYSLWANHLYTDLSVYRSEHAGGPAPVTGSNFQYNISGAAPYWRAAWQETWAGNYIEVGTYGIYLSSYPGAVSGPKDRYVDPSFDFQYERPFGANLLDVTARADDILTSLVARCRTSKPMQQDLSLGHQVRARLRPCLPDLLLLFGRQMP